MKLSLGFTGTQVGMDKAQKIRVVKKIIEYSLEYEELEIHHGDCIGADEQFHYLAIKYWPHKLSIVIHPPEDDRKRAFCQYDGDLTILNPKPYLVRNHDIVDQSTQMIATPKETEEQLRSGTWATVRYAKKTKKKGVIYYPKDNE